MAEFRVAHDIAGRLAELREYLDLKQPAFAKLFGRGRKQVSAWEHGHQAPPPAVLEWAAEHNGWPLEMFAEGGRMPAVVLRSPLTARGGEVRENGSGGSGARAGDHATARVVSGVTVGYEVRPPLGEAARQTLENRIEQVTKGAPLTNAELVYWLQLVRWIATKDAAAEAVETAETIEATDPPPQPATSRVSRRGRAG